MIRVVDGACPVVGCAGSLVQPGCSHCRFAGLIECCVCGALVSEGVDEEDWEADE